MIKTKQAFFSTSNSRGYSFHGNKTTTLCLTTALYSLSVLSHGHYFLEIGSVHRKLCLFKSKMLKTLNPNVLWCENTLSKTFRVMIKGFPKNCGISLDKSKKIHMELSLVQIICL